MKYRWMAAHEVDRLKEIDRTEQITVGYTVARGELRAMEVQWDVPAFFAEGRGEHTVAEQIEFCREYLQRRGRLMGAFDDDQLVGVGLLQPQIRPGMAQLAYLQVSQACRRLGIGTRLVRELEEEARASGAKSIYVSATPSGSAVGFYTAHGYTLAPEPLPELFALEPEDVHMIKEL